MKTVVGCCCYSHQKLRIIVIYWLSDPRFSMVYCLLMRSTSWGLRLGQVGNSDFAEKWYERCVVQVINWQPNTEQLTQFSVQPISKDDAKLARLEHSHWTVLHLVLLRLTLLGVCCGYTGNHSNYGNTVWCFRAVSKWRRIPTFS